MNLTAGAAAAAAGITALDTVSYLDMVVRGRPASEVPAEAADELAERAGIDLGHGEKADSRRTGLGALLGYTAGLGVGVLYGLLPGDRRPALPLAAFGLTVAAMAAGDIPLAAAGATDPRRWDATSWISDILPHLAYGLTTAVVYDRLTRPRGRPGRRWRRR
ncbi:hypothetical protein [Streptosporangium saharense]|uniref:Xanthosine utilization system XapX-like protein n=1 Tax=Streptosporangium saharense TaxID=1706840 RepID=A0A7W7QL43_9ACTN|nr:hypothetical protein [Streptosporangium saharense]MBB4915394.1 xanthosine utilization system XapX-like protein [Streptosporangium saharense]